METGLRLSLRDTLPQAALVALWNQFFFFYDCNGLSDKVDGDRSRRNFDRFVADHCIEPETLFIGEFLRERGICFEGPMTNERTKNLRNLLRRAFGFKRLQTEALPILNLNPRIWLGSQEIGCLQALVTKPAQGLRISIRTNYGDAS